MQKKRKEIFSNLSFYLDIAEKKKGVLSNLSFILTLQKKRKESTESFLHLIAQKRERKDTFESFPSLTFKETEKERYFLNPFFILTSAEKRKESTESSSSLTRYTESFPFHLDIAEKEKGNPQLDQVQESARPQKINTIGERLMVKEESAASVGTRPWTPEGRSLALSIDFML
ncbi:hypothetical protein AVEN_186806-1 [Araneus ventricosus]|uniref:Uncharacterized protein n=1 Tax=Araneus ventricosus TaxID=182803 RepID=A0A4Y2VX14_ARAVE|nr:hypothetical protein AVEN_186806-1 [Araneus ventricosus]